jgi:hypothetical protein
MDKLESIDQFLKFLPKINVEDEEGTNFNKLHKQNKQGKQNNKSRSQSKNPSEVKNRSGSIQSGSNGKNLSITEIHQKVKEKIKNFNTNSAKNSNVKKHRKSFKNTEKSGKGEKTDKTEKSAKSVNKNNNNMNK